MKRLLLPLLVLLLCAGPASARVTYGKDAATKPESYFSLNAQGLDSAAMLPPPPATGSTLFLHDRDMYAYGLSLRDTERGRQAGRKRRRYQAFAGDLFRGLRRPHHQRGDAGTLFADPARAIRAWQHVHQDSQGDL